MHEGKKIIGVIGKIASGKSYLLKILRENTKVKCINCDEIVAKVMPYGERRKIFETKGLKKLETIMAPLIKNKVFEEIKKSKNNVVAIEGINIRPLFYTIIDIYIEFDVPYKIRKDRSLKRGDKEEMFEYFNKRQEEIYG